MNNALRRATYLSLFLSLTATLPTVAQAQSTATAKGGGKILEEVIVTAQRRQERLQDVPISIAVYNQQQLNNRNIVNPSDLATYTPSLSADTRFGADNATFAIRGFTQEIRTTPSVGVYFAEVVEPNGGGHGTSAGNGAAPGDMFDLQNVQILKGPQGTLFGRNTTGGAILLVPQKPTSEFGGYIQGSLGNYNMHRVQGVVNIPFSDSVRLRLGMDRQTRNGYLRNIGIGPNRLADEDYWAGRASLVVDITPDLENYTIARFSQSDHNGTQEQMFACNPNALLGALGFCAGELARLKGQDYWTVDSSFPNPKSLVKQWQVINKTTWHASDAVTVSNIISYAQFKSIYRSGIFGDNFPTPATLDFTSLVGFPLTGSTGAYAGLPLNFTLSNPPPGHWTNAQSTFTEELRFNGTAFDEALTWQTGLYMEKSNPLQKNTGSQSNNFSYCSDLNNLQCIDIIGNTLKAAANSSLPPSVAALFPPSIAGAQLGLGSLEFSDYAAYAQTSYDFTDQWTLTVGARYTYDKTNGTARTVVYNFPTPNNHVASCPQGSTASLPDCYSSLSQTSHKPTWVVDLQYKPTDNAMVYGKYARGYRQGSVSPDSPVGLKSFDPEQVDTYELGAKLQWEAVVPGRLDIATFYNDFTNQQLQVGFAGLSSNLAASATTAIVNAGKSRIWGMEIDSTLQPFDGFSLSVNWSYLNTKLKSQTTPNVPSGYGLLFTSEVGKQLPFTPKNKVSVTAAYTLPLPAEFGDLSIAANYVFVAKELTSVSSPYGKIGPTKLINMNINWHSIFGSQFDASVFGTNLSNYKYDTYVPGLWSYGFETRALGEPRMWGVNLRYNFGA